MCREPDGIATTAGTGRWLPLPSVMLFVDIGSCGYSCCFQNRSSLPLLLRLTNSWVEIQGSCISLAELGHELHLSVGGGLCLPPKNIQCGVLSVGMEQRLLQSQTTTTTISHIPTPGGRGTLKVIKHRVLPILLSECHTNPPTLSTRSLAPTPIQAIILSHADYYKAF
jgi:hypothetical protein